MGHLLYVMSSFVHYFKAISEFKLELQSGNTQFGWKSAIFVPSRVTLKFVGDLVKQQGTSSMVVQALCIISQPSLILNWSYSPETPNLGQTRFFSCYLEIWWMTLKNNRAHFLCYFKLCTSFRSHQAIKNGVAVRNIGSKSGILCPMWAWH